MALWGAGGVAALLALVLVVGATSPAPDLGTSIDLDQISQVQGGEVEATPTPTASSEQVQGAAPTPPPVVTPKPLVTAVPKPPVVVAPVRPPVRAPARAPAPAPAPDSDDDDDDDDDDGDDDDD